jgi:spore germination protein KB
MAMGVEMTNRTQKFSNLQLFMMMIGFITPFGHFIFIRLTYVYAGRNAWISLFFSAILGVIFIYIQLKSASRSPDQSLIGESIQAFGTWFGRLIGFIYICFFLLACSLSIHVFTQFLNLLFPLTPSFVFIFCILFTMAYVVHAGSEALSRTIQVALPVLMVLGALVSILIVRERDWKQLLPIMEDGFFPVWHGTIIFLCMFSELVVFRMLIPHTNTPKKLPKQGLFFVMIVLFMFLGPTTGPIMIFGEDLAKFSLYPTFEEIRYIQLFDFIERLDVLGIFLWVTGAFIRTSVFLLGAAEGMAELFNANKDNIYVLPITFLIFALELSLKSYTPEKTYHFLAASYSVITIFLGILLPLIIDMFIRFRHKWKSGWNGGKEV